MDAPARPTTAAARRRRLLALGLCLVLLVQGLAAAHLFAPWHRHAAPQALALVDAALLALQPAGSAHAHAHDHDHDHDDDADPAHHPGLQRHHHERGDLSVLPAGTGTDLGADAAAALLALVALPAGAAPLAGSAAAHVQRATTAWAFCPVCTAPQGRPPALLQRAPRA